ncbi:MAG: GNAT family N-acetyltransferase [Chthoniobacterales bacterium]
MKVRFYQPSEIANLANIFTDAVRSIKPTDYSPTQLAAWAPIPPDFEYWHHRLCSLNVLIAEEDSKIMGFATFESNGHLDHLYVHPEFQRRGVASALCHSIEQELLFLGITRIFTDASITARPFFEYAGFKMITSQTVQHAGISFVNYQMEKHLPKQSPPAL